jgi:multidrug efflux pump subunit AcrB
MNLASSNDSTGFESAFAHFHTGYLGLLHVVIGHRIATFSVVGAVVVLAAGLFTFVGQDYFPQIDAGELTLHMRTRPGMRIESAEQQFGAVEDVIRQVIKPPDLGLILDNIGLPASNYNFAFGDGSFVSNNDGQILISLKKGHASTDSYRRALRKVLQQKFPDTVFYFQPADIITQLLNFGTLTPIDVQVTGRNPAKDLEVAKHIEARLRNVRGAVDVHIQQILDAPEFFADVDRQKAGEIGLTEQQIANTLNVSQAGSFQVTPNFWADPKSGIPYQLWVQTPEYRNASLSDVGNTPLFVSTAMTGTTTASSAPLPGVVTLFNNVAKLRRQSEQTVVNHVNTQPKYDIFASVQDRDLGSVSRDIETIMQDEQKTLPAPDRVSVLGQIADMHSAFQNIGIGLAIAIIAVYLLMSINYQSWGDPFRGAGGAAAGVLRHRDEPVCDPDHLLDSLVVRRDHERRRRQRQFDFAGDISPRASRRDRLQCRRSCDQGRRDSAATGADDGSGDVRRTHPYGARNRRRQRKERGPSSRRA